MPMTRLTASPPITANPLQVAPRPLCPSRRPFDNGLLQDRREILGAKSRLPAFQPAGSFPGSRANCRPRLGRLPGAGQKALAALDLRYSTARNAQKMIREMTRTMV